MSTLSPALPGLFAYRHGALHVEDADLRKIADRVGTPVYCYSESQIIANYRAYDRAFADLPALICYAVKAASNLAIIETLAKCGAGADVVSGGELLRARRAGVPGDKIAFAGVGKTPDEMRLGLIENIRQFNVESIGEISMLQTIAASMGVTAPVVLRINPDIDAETHEKITTGKKDNKFGISIDEIPSLLESIKHMPNIEMLGFGMHIGSQLTSIAPFEDAYRVMRQLVVDTRQSGISVKTVDLGGGLGIAYRDEAIPEPTALAALAGKYFGDLSCGLILEPGRSIIGNAGVLLTRVIGVKHSGKKRFVIVDAAMNDLLRPTLYQAWHDIVPVDEASHLRAKTPADLVGPVCETGDYLAQSRDMPDVECGDLLVLAGAGAYGASMASEYNTRPLVPEVMARGEQYHIIRRRPDFNDMIRLETLPQWR